MKLTLKLPPDAIAVQALFLDFGQDLRSGWQLDENPG
jgi:hypothetical protein